MVPAVKKQVDVARLNAELASAKVELLSAQCAVDRIRLQYSTQDIASFGDRQSLKRAIASAGALQRFFSQIENDLGSNEAGANSRK